MNSTDHQDIYGISGSTGSKKLLETGKYSITQDSASQEYFADASSILAFFYHGQCYFFTACVPTNVGIMFQLDFVFSTIKDTLKGLGENISKQKKTSCEIDKVRKLSKHKRIAKNFFVWNFFV